MRLRDIVAAAISIHALLAESDSRLQTTELQTLKFLSTLSLRRATETMGYRRLETEISIHALLAESDFVSLSIMMQLCISIHALLAESDFWYMGARTDTAISIHALLAESDICLPPSTQ